MGVELNHDLVGVALFSTEQQAIRTYICELDNQNR